ncbi:hypothetical protein HRG_012221 [Hirsutella rhossiliensis]
MSQRRKYAMASLAAADQAARLVIESHDDLEEGRRRQTRGPPPKPVSVTTLRASVETPAQNLTSVTASSVV